VKYVLVLLVVVGGLWLWLRRRDSSQAPGRENAPPAESARPKAPMAPAAQTMLACAHCGVHLPQSDAQMDASGRPFCSEAHRLAGPR